MKALLKNIIIEPIKLEEKSIGGIIRPETNQEKYPDCGKIISKGHLVTSEVKEKDIVYFKKFSASEIKEDGKTYLVISEDDLLSIK